VQPVKRLRDVRQVARELGIVAVRESVVDVIALKWAQQQTRRLQLGFQQRIPHACAVFPRHTTQYRSNRRFDPFDLLGPAWSLEWSHCYCY